MHLAHYACQLTEKGAQAALLFLFFHHQPDPAHRPNRKLENARTTRPIRPALFCRCPSAAKKYSPLYGVVESGAARLMRMRTSLELSIEKAGGVLGAVTATKSARWTSSR